MKKTIFALAFAIVSSFQVSAQDNNTKPGRKGNSEQRTEQRIQMLDKKLKLTDEQKTKIRNLYTEFNKKQYSREEHKEAREKLNTSITQLLSAEQQTTYKKMVEEQKAKMKERKGKSPRREKASTTE